MHIKTKLLTGAKRLRAALAETDPFSLDLILISAHGNTPALRLRPGLAAARCPVPASQASLDRPGDSRDNAPCWRQRFVRSPKTGVPA
jgi:hypothetical protein